MSLSGPGMVFPLRRPEFALCFRGLSGVTHRLIGFFFQLIRCCLRSFGYFKFHIRSYPAAEGGGARAVHLLVIVYIR